MNLRIEKLVALALLLLAASAHAAPDPIKLPAELAAFVPADHIPIGQSSADLNRDGTPDTLLVVQDKKDEDGPRALLVITRGKDGVLKLAARNDKVVFCEKCGGVMGDPFQEAKAGAGQFEVSHYGGSSWRWSNVFKFAYSRRDDAWQLVRVEEQSFHASDPDKAKQRVYTPPRDYGLIDFRQFDPEKFRNVGKK